MAWKEVRSKPAFSQGERVQQSKEASGGAATLGAPRGGDQSHESAQETGSAQSQSVPFKAQVPAPWTLQCP